MPDFTGTTDNEEVITARKRGDQFPRFSVEADGTIKTGDGATVPSDLSSRYASDAVFRAAAYGTLDPTGVTSSYAAIDAAVTAAVSAGGGTVVLPGGEFLIGDNTITLPALVNLVGAGRYATTIKSTSATGKDVIAVSGARVRIADLGIEGAAGGGFGINFASATSRSTVERVVIESTGGGGVQFAGTNFLMYLFDVEVNSATGVGFRWANSGTHNSFTLVECYANSCTGNGYEVAAAIAVNMIGCAADTNGAYGFQGASSRINFIGCTAEVNTTGGFYVAGSGIYRYDGCRTTNQILPWSTNGSGATIIQECESSGTPSGNSVSIGASGTNTRNRLIGGSFDRPISVNATGFLLRDGSGPGTPEGAVVGSIGSTWRRTDGGAGTSFYVKESGVGNTGWVAK